MYCVLVNPAVHVKNPVNATLKPVLIKASSVLNRLALNPYTKAKLIIKNNAVIGAPPSSMFTLFKYWTGSDVLMLSNVMVSP